ncbi:hypothetical protein CLOM_g19434 [Closterium sp. NIES-68]|nr:hypothetical protein CLOM_g19434 [Closterium sp. NIES-68]GJP76128.1 hypothetical protein CLOP_g6502 [Closterium sp. NIES-67]
MGRGRHTTFAILLIFLYCSAAATLRAAAADPLANTASPGDITADTPSAEPSLTDLAEPTGSGTPNVFLASDYSTGATVASNGAETSTFTATATTAQANGSGTAASDTPSTEPNLTGLAEPTGGSETPNVFLASDYTSSATISSYGATNPSAAGGGLFTTASADAGTVVGTATTAGTGVGTATTAGTGVGTATTAGTGVGTATTAGTAVGTATTAATAVGTATTAGTAVGTATTAGTGVGTATTAGTGVGTATTAGTGVGTTTTAGTGVGTATTAGTGVGTATTAGTGVGTATTAGTGVGTATTAGTGVGTATTAGTATAPPPPPSAPSSGPCNVTATSISCVGFSSSSSSPMLSSPFFQLNGDAQVGPGPNFPIWLDTTTNAAGCALSIPSLNLSLGTEAGGTGSGSSSGGELVAFEAAFSFSFAASADYNSWGNRGLAFVITAGEKTACGRSAKSAIGYGFAPNNSFAQSIAVEMRSRPTACVAVVVGGEVAGDNCADSDAMALLPPAQAFTLNEPQHVWVSYDGSTRALQVFVSPGGSPSKPQSATLVAPVDVRAVLGATSGISVGFTGGSWWTWVDDLEDHIIHSLSFEAVPPGSQQSLPPSAPPSKCRLTSSNTRLACTGFAGRSPFFLNGYAHVGPAPDFPLVLDTGGTAGSALTLADLALSLDASTSAGGAAAAATTAAAAAVVAFEAAFSFSVLTETSYGYRGSRGLAFVITSGDKTACGSSDMGAIGYGGAAPGAFNRSVAVELRSGPTSCVALVVNGMASGDNCAAADQMTGLTGEKAFALNEPQHAWVAYDSSSQSLEVYLGGSDGVKPEEPVLRAALDLVAVIGASSASVGFTAGTWWWGCGDTDDHHLIHTFSFNTVTPGFLPAAQPTPTATCRATKSSLHCAGFAGSAPFDLNGYAQLGPAPLFPLWLDSYNTVGSALSLSPLPLLTPSGLSTAFEAAFSFTFLADECAANVSVGRGFTFVLTNGPTTALGHANASSLGYGSAGGAFLNSVAVEFRLCPVPCIAVSAKGVVAGDGCVGAEYAATLSDAEAFPLNTQQHAWVTYEGASQTLKVFLAGAPSTPSTSPVKPAVPVLTAFVDIPAILGATSASVGFTAGTWWWQWGANERHIVHDLALVGGTFFETSSVTAELTARFDPANQTELAAYSVSSIAPSPTTNTTTSTATSSTTTTITTTTSPTTAPTTATTTSASLASLTPDSTPPTMELRFSPEASMLPGAQRPLVARQQTTASRPTVRAHVYISNTEQWPMADVAVTTRITYPNGTDASHCFVFSDPVLDGIAYVNGAGTLAPNSSASVDWLLLVLDCAAPAAPTNFKLGGSLQYTLPDTSASSVPSPSAPSAPAPALSTAGATSAPSPAPSATAAAATAPAAAAPPVVKQVNLTSVRVTVAPPPKLQVHYFVPKHVQGDDLDTPQVEAPVPITLGALVYNAGHGTAAAVATQSLLPVVNATSVPVTITQTAVGEEPQPPSFSVQFFYN